MGARIDAEDRRHRFRPRRQTSTSRRSSFAGTTTGSRASTTAWPPSRPSSSSSWDGTSGCYENEYPLARTDYRPFYFASGGKANSDRGDGRLTWTSQRGASRPIGSATIQTIRSRRSAATTAAARRRSPDRGTSARSSAVATSSSTRRISCTEEIEVTGPVKVVLHASSDAPDTDFVAKLVDVYPDGSSYNMAEGHPARALSGEPQPPRPLTPGKVYRFEIDLVGTSVAFLKGHRIRVHVTSSHFPQFDRNPNTGAIRHDERGARRAADRSPRRRAAVAHPAAGDSASFVRTRRRQFWRRPLGGRGALGSRKSEVGSRK